MKQPLHELEITYMYGYNLSNTVLQEKIYFQQIYYYINFASLLVVSKKNNNNEP